MIKNPPIAWQFGPLWTERGVVFRLWGPAAQSVEVVLDEATVIPTDRDDEGWWCTKPQALAAGTRYAFRINNGVCVPDPASRAQRDDVHGPSILTAPEAHRSNPPGWNGRAWEETVFYELHVGSCGTFSSLGSRLHEIAEIGITAVELMPIADFPGKRNWGYDGVLPFAPDTAYGTPHELRNLVDAAHRENLSIWLDVVYNHFGPEGNYLHVYAPQFFNKDVHTPWGAAIDFTVPQVRRYFFENALYWIHEIGFDGLRLDAVHAIHDPSPTHFLTELAEIVHRHLNPERAVYLVLENDRNEARFLGSGTDSYIAQWNDDIHHAFHVLLTGETHGYYQKFSRDPEADLARAFATGFVDQGDGEAEEAGMPPRGEPSGHLSPTRFIAFLQNHDQIGNRAFGERLITLTDPAALRAAIAAQLLCPQIPLLFMGEPWGATEPFQFFCDFGEELSQAVREGRRREFGLEELPDPSDEETFRRSVPGRSANTSWRAWYGHLLDLRRQHLVPLLPDIQPGNAQGGGENALVVRWEPGWMMELNLHPTPRRVPRLPRSLEGMIIFSSFDTPGESDADVMPPWSVRVRKENSR